MSTAAILFTTYLVHPASRGLFGQETPQPTIKVDVRQVLVPVIVTDKDGHHVTGLTQADFRVFEDSVEQEISAFAVESSGLSRAEAITAATKPGPAIRAASPDAAPARRTYLICIDVLHTSFPNFAHLRDALKKLFREEPAGDSQYSVVAMGRTVQLVQATTRDPASVLKVIEGKDFQKVLQGSYKDSLQAELDGFRRQLDEVRHSCDTGEPDCRPRKQSLPPQANQMAEHDRMLTPEFLRQFRGVVEQLSHATGRRTIVFISDGFSLTPGKAALECLAAYFPEMRSVALRAKERMQSDFEPVVRLAATSDIPIYTIDSRGLYGMQYFDASDQGSVARMAPSVQQTMNDIALGEGDTLAEMAAATGGTAFHNNNDLLAGLKRAFADGREYYTLAYVSTNANLDGKFRTIRVEVRERKVVVNAKRGYWATGN